MTNSPRILWTQFLEIIRKNVNEQQYQTWFTPIKFIDRNGNLLDLKVDARDLEGLARLLEQMK